MTEEVHVCTHPLIQEKLLRLRDKNTNFRDFRLLMSEVGALLGYEALRSLSTRDKSVETFLGRAQGRSIESPVTLVAILRAGLGMLPGLLEMLPSARIGHIGLYRNEETLNPVRYYVRLPKDIKRCHVILCDPMLATGGSAVEALRILRAAGARKLSLVTLLSARAGVRRVRKAYPDVQIFTAAVDPKLNRAGYIVPGLGDAGDRMFGT